MEERDLKFVKIDKENIEDAYRIYLSNKEYFELCGSENISLDMIYEDLNAFPEGVSDNQKIYRILYNKNEPLGILDLITSYPNSDTFYIGLFLIDKEKQGLTYGSWVYNTVEEKMESLGYKKGRLGVLDNNSKGLKFWEKMGYRTTKTVVSTIKPEKNWTVNVMENHLRKKME